MAEKTNEASRAASILGSQTSPRKAETSANNGKKGGRPTTDAIAVLSKKINQPK